jgi:hypothetical protein
MNGDFGGDHGDLGRAFYGDSQSSSVLIDTDVDREINVALNSDYPATALCRLQWLKVIPDAEAALKSNLANDLFTYVCDLEGQLETARRKLAEARK